MPTFAPPFVSPAAFPAAAPLAWGPLSFAPPAPGSGRPAAETRFLSEGDAGTEETVREMVRLIEEGSRDPVIHALAHRIVHQARVPPFDFAGERRAVYEWMRRSIRFFRDIDGKETLKAARRTVELAGGDCDCQSILVCALLKSIGQRTRIVTISSHPRAPEIFSHVFAEVRDERGRWVPVDAARRQARYGRGPQHWYRRRHWDTEDGSFEDVAGLNFYVTNSFPLPTTGRGRFLLQPGVPAARPAAAGGLGALGAAGARRLRRRLQLARLGQDDGSGFDVSQLETEIPSIEQGTAQIISAARANPLNITASSLPLTASQANQLTPAAQALLSSSNPLASVPSWMWLLGGGVVLLFAMRGRG